MTTVRETFGLVCPNCGSDEHLVVESTCCVRLHPDGTEDVGDQEWTVHSYCACHACDASGCVAEFSGRGRCALTCDQLKTWLVSRESRVSHATLVRSVTSEEAIACGQGLLETHLDAFIEDNHREEWHAELQEGLGPDAVRIAYRPPGRPVMAPPDNLQRAAWADKAVQAFLAETACDAQNCLRDLLCDLMHWAAVSGFDFASELERAQYHYDAEVGR